MGDIHLQDIITTENNNGHGHTENGTKEQVTAANGGGVLEEDVPDSALSIHSHLLHKDKTLDPEANTNQHDLEESMDGRIGRTSAHKEKNSTLGRLKRELNEKVWKIRLWMVLLIIFFLILIVIIISVALCSVVYEDADEKFDVSTFVMRRDFNGKLRLPNQVFLPEMDDMSTNQSRTLSAQLRKKLNDLYTSSPALGRYFNRSEILALSDDSGVVASYRLLFLMPRDNEQLQRFTLSREVVFNVLRQHLYDQSPEEEGTLYIDPALLEMEQG